jgi:hypothetical protein
MKAACDMYNRCKRRVKRLQEHYKTEDASAVAEAVTKSAETFQQADTLVDTPVSGANDQHLISH